MQLEEEIFFRKIANESDLVTLEQIEECLEVQRQSPKAISLFVIMIEKGYISRKNMAEILKKAPPQLQQQREGDDKKITKKFGELCVEKGFATTAQIAECLAIQERLKKEGKVLRIEQILTEKKYVAMREAKLVLEMKGQKILS